ncbi:MAG: hypothetical protein EOO40_02420 [Deltaproteobacteria bacterium]|nr:MAG: hypothetical protein EOO40_02420 [Deltaproteobacteria bacterium]
MLSALILSWLALAGSVYVTASLLPGVHLRSGTDAFAVAAIFGVLNTLLGWALFISIGLGTLGIGFLVKVLTRWLVNAILLAITDRCTDRLTIDGFGWALGAALMMSACGSVLEILI